MKEIYKCYLCDKEFSFDECKKDEYGICHCTECGTMVDNEGVKNKPYSEKLKELYDKHNYEMSLIFANARKEMLEVFDKHEQLAKKEISALNTALDIYSANKEF